ncbi:MAG: tetratricopeptide repeat protein [Rhodoferax sp.]|nr:tetratricopeptide repeat protein [Rhodoferax sp.]
MTTTRGQKMLKSIEASMKLSTLAPEARAQQVAKLCLTKRIDHILYTQWDPCGVHALRDVDCSDEYQDYLPTLVNRVMDGATFAELSDQLMQFEEAILGTMGSRRRCDVIAVMVAHYGPHADKNPFLPVINTQTPASAYLAVLDLVTQTRLDAYQGKWRLVRDGYEMVVTLCHDHLSDKHGLYGACLNNLGWAYSKTGELGNAAQMYARALDELAHGVHSDHQSLMSCMKNLINNLAHRRQFAATLPYHHQRVDVLNAAYGWFDDRTREAIASGVAAENTKRPAPKLHPVRVDVERDGCTRINQLICVD